MKPQGVLFRSPTPPAAKPPQIHAAPPAATSAPHHLTRLLHHGSRFNLFRAATTGDLGPGCYILKTPRPNLIDPELATAMLHREATIATTLKHPNLNCILSADVHSPEPYLLLPYHDGISLRQLLDHSRVRISVSRALSVVRQVAAALIALHTAGWLHGQVRPEHILLSPQGAATLIDFTLGRRLETSECETGNLTAANAPYAAPETTLEKRRLTAAAETYSLGILLFEILTSHPPYSGHTLAELLTRHRHNAIPDIRALRADVPLETAHLLHLLLAKEPMRRPTDSELLRWLTELEIASL